MAPAYRTELRGLRLPCRPFRQLLMFGHLTDITARADLADRLRLAAPAPDCSSSPGAWTGALRRVGVPHPINPRLPKSATPVGATRDLAHWAGVDSVRVAKALITTRPPLNGSSQLSACIPWDWRGPPMCPVPAPPQCNSRVVGPLCHASGRPLVGQSPSSVGSTPHVRSGSFHACPRPEPPRAD